MASARNILELPKRVRDHIDHIGGLPTLVDSLTAEPCEVLLGTRTATSAVTAAIAEALNEANDRRTYDLVLCEAEVAQVGDVGAIVMLRTGERFSVDVRKLPMHGD